MNVKDDGAEPDLPLMPRAYNVSDLLDGTVDIITITADEAERQAIAEALELPALAELRALLKVKPGRGIVHVTGQVKARMTRECVVTLEPFDCDVSGDVDVRFSGDPAEVSAGVTDIPGNEADWIDPPDAITGEKLDLGAVALEHLVLAMDPYPRKPGAAFSQDMAGDDSGEKDSPFAALQALNLGEKSAK